MFKQIQERKYLNKTYYGFYHNFPKSVDCNSHNSISNKRICSDFAIETLENKYLLCGFVDGNINIYNMELFLENTSAQVFSLHESPQNNKNYQIIKCLQWYPVDSGLFFTCGADKKVKIWDSNKGKCVEEISLSYNTNWISLSPCAKSLNLIATACDKNRTILIDLISGSSTHVLTNYSIEPVQTLQWSNREDYILATGDQGGHVSLWDVRATKKALFHLDQYQDQKNDSVSYSNCQAHGGSIRGLEFSPDGIAIATLGNDGRVNVWNLYSCKAKLMDLNFGTLFETSKVARHVRFFWTGYSNYKKIWIPSNLDIIRLNVTDGTATHFQSMHFDQITSCLWNEGYHQLYTTGLDSNILNWTSVL